MISIIISTYNKTFFENLCENIKNTCDVEYEIIQIENNNRMGLCKAYNIGAAKAKFPYLMFIHEDIKIISEQWGSKLIKLLNEDKTGVIGLSGSNYYPNFPGSWWNSDLIYTNLIQYHSDGTSTKYLSKNFNENSDKEEVKGLDGVFMACSANVYNEFKFDERIEDYHCYDLIFSLKVASKYQNYVTNEILIEHFSNGKLDKKWIANILKVKKIIGNINSQKTVVNTK